MKSTYKVRAAIAYKANLIAIFVNISLFLASKNDYRRLSTKHASHASGSASSAPEAKSQGYDGKCALLEKYFWIAAQGTIDGH